MNLWTLLLSEPDSQGTEAAQERPMAGDVVALEIPALPEFVAVVRVVVAAVAAARSAFAEERIDDFTLAVSEACTNAIEAQGAAAVDERVLVRCWAAEGCVEVQVQDRGGGFDPAKLRGHPAVNHPDRLKFERGLGIPLIRALVDEVEFKPSPGGTAVRLVMNDTDRKATGQGIVRH